MIAQRPGIRNRVEMDLHVMYRLASLPDLIHLFGGTRTRDVIDDFAAWLDDELDHVTKAIKANPHIVLDRIEPGVLPNGDAFSIRQSVY